MPEESAPSGITKNFLEKCIGQEIGSFTVKPGSNLGDNFTSILHSLEIFVKGSGKPLHLLLKCYPEHPLRQQFLNQTSLFLKELEVYKNLIPAFEGVVPKELKSKLKSPTPKLVAGEAVDYRKLPESELAKLQDTSNLTDYILMVDVRKTFGFKMTCRYLGLDYNHCKLIVQELAKFHSLSWAYKVKNENVSLVEKFPCVEESFVRPELKDLIGGMLKANFGIVQNSLQNYLESNVELQKNLEKLSSDPYLYLEKFIINQDHPSELVNLLRVKPNAESNNNYSNEPWKVANHGDSWVNNMLFRYCNESGVPIEAILVDLQLVREACPTTDLAYFFYTSTTSELRSKHLEDLLECYSHHFLNNCKLLGVKPLPGFESIELKRRFHVSKFWGVLMAIVVLPIILQEQDNTVDLDGMKIESGVEGEESSFSDMLSSVSQNASENSLLMDRFKNLFKELHEEGVI